MFFTSIIGASVSEPHLKTSTRPLSVCLYISYVSHFGPENEERPRSPRTWEESLRLRLHTELHDIVLRCMILVYIIIHIHLQLHRHHIIIIMYIYLYYTFVWVLLITVITI